MTFKNLWRALLVGLAFASWMQTCHARVVSFSAVDRGWYSIFQSVPVNIPHNPNSLNYAAGRIGSQSFRNFFVFDLSGLQILDSQSVTAASFVLDTHVVATQEVVETVEFFDVTSPIDDLLNGVFGSAGVSIFNDLGTGTSYGAQLYSASDSFTQKSIALNSFAIANIRNAAGSRFAIGGALVTPSSDTLVSTELICGDSEMGSSTIRLDLTIVPEPSTFALTASSLLALSLIRRWGQRHQANCRSAAEWAACRWCVVAV